MGKNNVLYMETYFAVVPGDLGEALDSFQGGRFGMRDGINPDVREARGDTEPYVIIAERLKPPIEGYDTAVTSVTRESATNASVTRRFQDQTKIELHDRDGRLPESALMALQDRGRDLFTTYFD